MGNQVKLIWWSFITEGKKDGGICWTWISHKVDTKVQGVAEDYLKCGKYQIMIKEVLCSQNVNDFRETAKYSGENKKQYKVQMFVFASKMTSI